MNFNLYTEGDEEYKKELGALMIGNLREMREALPNAVRCNDSTSFLKICHKVKVTLSMLDDVEFNSVIESLRVDITTHGKGSDETNLKRFLERCDLVIARLTKEIGGLSTGGNYAR